MILTIIAAIFVFGLLVLVHELGHFITAKLTDMRVDEFAIGFGPKILSYKYGETVYSVRSIPLGGFNNIAGMDPEDNNAGERGYSAKSVRARMVVILAGSFMNFLLPLLLFFGIFFFAGVSTPSMEPVLGTVIEHKPAAEAGLRAGDRIVRIDGQDIDSWVAFVDTIRDGDGKVFKIEFKRGDVDMATTLIPVYDSSSKRAMVGVMSSVDTMQPGLAESASLAVQKTGYILYRMMDGLVQIFTGESAAELAGPLGVAQMAGEVAQIGFVPLLNFAALLSLNLGIINLFPIPALDGGHFMTLVVEAIRGKPLSAKALRYAQSVGFALLLALMLFATKNDIVRVFLGN
jgi:regulator of sigma E protease